VLSSGTALIFRTAARSCWSGSPAPTLPVRRAAGPVDNHWSAVPRRLLSTCSASAPSWAQQRNEIARAIRDGARESVGDAGQEVVRRQLEIRPTLTIRPGHPVRVVVTRDLVLEPYGGGQ
jgi:type IV secretion system protein VirB10